MAHHLFVYGTLLERDNEFAGYLNQHCRLLTAGKIKGTLYDIGEYPALIINEKSNSLVYGNVYEVDNDALSLIDDYEGYGPTQSQPYLYLRVVATIKTNHGSVDAWIYVYNHPIDGYNVIPSGDYLEYIAQKKSPGT